jgi:hypothetical protein
VQAKKTEKLRAELILRDIGVNPSFLESLTASRFSTGNRTSGSKFATIGSHWNFNPERNNRTVSYIGVPAYPNTGSYILKDNPIKVGIATFIGVVSLYMEKTKEFQKTTYLITQAHIMAMAPRLNKKSFV